MTGAIPGPIGARHYPLQVQTMHVTRDAGPAAGAEARRCRPGLQPKIRPVMDLSGLITAQSERRLSIPRVIGPGVAAGGAPIVPEVPCRRPDASGMRPRDVASSTGSTGPKPGLPLHFSLRSRDCQK